MKSIEFKIISTPITNKNWKLKRGYYYIVDKNDNHYLIKGKKLYESIKDDLINKGLLDENK